jgi:hypothetical protein
VSKAPPAPARSQERPAGHERIPNRELSRLDFDGRVLELGLDRNMPLLERANLCAILSTNLDQFFMVRVAGLPNQAASGLAPRSADGADAAGGAAACSTSRAASRSSGKRSSSRRWSSRSTSRRRGRLVSRFTTSREAEMEAARKIDPRTGRPLDEHGQLAVSDLTYQELEAELTTAASAPNHQRFDRFLALLGERERRRALVS